METPSQPRKNKHTCVAHHILGVVQPQGSPVEEVRTICTGLPFNPHNVCLRHMPEDTEEPCVECHLARTEHGQKVVLDMHLLHEQRGCDLCTPLHNGTISTIQQQCGQQFPSDPLHGDVRPVQKMMFLPKSGEALHHSLTCTDTDTQTHTHKKRITQHTDTWRPHSPRSPHNQHSQHGRSSTQRTHRTHYITNCTPDVGQ